MPLAVVLLYFKELWSAAFPNELRLYEAYILRVWHHSL